MILNSKKYNGTCSCGKNHEMDTRLVVIEQGCLNDFSKYMKEVELSGNICTVYDSNTYNAKGIVRPKAEQEIILDPENLHANEVAVEQVLVQLNSDIDILVAIGSGTIHDITRYCAHKQKIPFVACPTAATVDGFCSTVSAMTWHGYKTTLPGIAPVLVLADLDVIKQAPAHLALSGVGDILGKYTALADWKISAIVTGEFFCSKIESMTRQAIETVYESASEISGGSVSAFEKLTYGLLLSGLAMQLMGNSRPASGAEHHISHMIEMEPVGLGLHSEALHGEKVGVGTIITSQRYHQIAAIDDIAPYVTTYNPPDLSVIKEFFGERLIQGLIDENKDSCVDLVTGEAIIENWDKIQKVIKEIPTSNKLKELYQKAGMKYSLKEIQVPDRFLPDLLKFSPFVRNRLTFMRIQHMLNIPFDDE